MREAWLVVVLGGLLVSTPLAQTGVKLTATIAPAAGQPGIHSLVATGSGFPSGTIPPANVTITLEPVTPGGGPSVAAIATGVATVIATTRRVTFKIPPTLLVGAPTAYTVGVSGTTSTGVAFTSSNRAALTVNPPAEIVSVQPALLTSGQSVSTTISTNYTDFLQGATVASFGPGVSVGGAAEGAPGRVTVTSRTTATAQVTINASAAAGPRTVTVATGVQTASLVQGVTISGSEPVNHDPTADAGGPYSGTAGQAITFTGTGSDPDADAITFAWAFSDGGTASGASVAHTFVAAGSYTATLTVSDTRGGSNTAAATVTVRAPNVAPQVTIAPASPVRLPATATVSATVTDDGQVLATPTLTWSLVSGPADGTALFAPPDAAATVVTFNKAGSYVLRLSANDGAAIGAADVTLTVIPKNDPPVVGASGDTAVVLPAAAALHGTATDDGEREALTYQWAKASGSGTVTFSTPTALDTNATFSEPGTYVLRLTAADGEFNPAAEVTVVASAPAADNQAPQVNAGADVTITLPVTASLAGTAADDGKPAGSTLDSTWSKWSGPGNVAFSDQKSPSTTATFGAAGVYVLHLTATDGALTTTDDVVVTVNGGASAGDRLPPVVTLTVASTALPGAQVDVRAQASDNDRVSLIRIAIQGQAPVEAAASTLSTVLSVPPVATPGQVVEIVATASDPASNEGTARASVTVTAVPDTTPPEVQLRGPSSAAPGQGIELVALATDAGGVASVTFLADGTQVGQSVDSPFTARYTVASDAVPGSTIALVARVSDAAGNVAESTVSVTVSADKDVVPPTVALTISGNPLPGATVTLSADASDASGIATVAFSADGVVVATLANAPYAFSYTIPASTTGGTTLQVAAVATDFAGLSASDTTPLAVATPVQAAQALAVGEAYDDSTGLLLAGATARLLGPAASGSSPTATTDSRGRYVLQGTSGDGVVRVEKDGWATVDRPVTLASGVGTEVFDARLTPLAALPVPVSSVLGGSVGNATASLAVPPGALAQTSTLRVTAVGQQGLQGLLPYGWSPVGAVDVLPHETAFVVTAPLTAANGHSVAAGTALVVARWDETSFAWRKVADTTVPADGKLLEVGIVAGGQYAWLLPDTPASPVADGDPIPGAASPVLPADVTTLIAPEPKVAFYKPGIHSEVRGQLTPAAAVSSGVRVWQRLVESYTYYSGVEVHPEPVVQDLVFFRVPGTAAPLAATSVVTPSMTFEALALELGTIKVELSVPSGASTPAPVVGADGATVPGPGGESLIVPPGAVVDVTAVRLATLTSDQVGFPLPAGLALAGGVQVTFAGEWSRGATLSIPKPSGATAGDQFLLVRLAEIGGRTRLVLVAVGRVDGERLVAETTVGGRPTSLGGITAPGRYLFVEPAAAVGYSQGIVRATTGGQPSPFAGAVVSATAFDVVSVSTAAGSYFAAAPAGAVTLTALDVAKGDTGSAATFVTAGSVLAVPLLIEAQVPRIVSVSPADGATNVALADPVVVTFSKAIDAATVSGANAGNIVLAGSTGAVVQGTGALSAGNTVFTFRPGSALAANTHYTITVNSAIRDVAGYGLAASVTTAFDSLDTAPPPAPAAGTISASVPGTDGQTTINATQGTVARTDTVHVVNLTDRTTRLVPQALYQANGSFQFQAPAKITDKLQLRIVDAAGNETLVDLDRFQQTNADGSVSAALDGAGGIVEGVGGVQVDVPDDTFPAGAVVTIDSVATSSLPVQLSEADRQNFEYQAALSVDFGGVEAARYVNLSIPARGDETADSSWVVTRLAWVGGRQVMSVVDTAKLIAGRIRTSSPPFPGLLHGGTYTFVRSTGSMGVAHGRVLVLPGNEEFIKLTMMTLSPSLLGVMAELPFIATGPNAASWGFPLLAGRVTITENQSRLTVSPSVIAPAHRMLRVRNTDTTISRSFPVSPVDYRMEVPGKLTDGFDIQVDGPAGKQAVKNARLASALAGVVTIRLNPDTITVPVRSVTVTNRISKQVSSFAFAPAPLTVSVPGTTAAPRIVELLDLKENSTWLLAGQFDVVDSPDGPGNLVLHIQGGTFEAGEANDMRLVGQDASETPVPFGPADVGHDFRFAFAGNANALFSLAFDREGHTYQRTIPRFFAELTDTLSGKAIRTVSGFVPPADAPLDLGTITDDTSAPYLVDGPSRIGSFDPGGTLVFTFSEAMDAESLKTYITVTDSHGNKVEGEIRVTGGNTVATFVPSQPLKMGERYSVTLQGADPLTAEEIAAGKKASAVRDGAGNPIGTMTLKVTTFTPTRVGSLPGAAPFKDVAMRRRKSEGVTTTTLFVTTGGQSNNLLSIDATNPRQPAAVGAGSAAMSQQRIALLTDVAFTGRDNRVFTGDLAVTTHFSVNFSSMVFFDVTNPAAPAIVGGKLLTLNPDLLEGGANTTGTVVTNGYAKGVAAFKTTTGAAAYAAVEHVGLMPTDVALNTPQRTAGDRVSEGAFSGQITDVAAGRSSLFAISPTSGLNFFVLDPAVNPVASTGLSYTPRRLRVVDGIEVDANGDGLISNDEVYTLAVVGGDRGISIVDVRNTAAPAEIGRIPLPGYVRDIEVDPVTRRIVAGVDLVSGGPSLVVIDLSKPEQASADADGDGFDDRVLWKAGYSAGVNGMRLDGDRGLLYIASPSGLDIWALYDSCCDLGVDLKPVKDTRADGATPGLLLKEKVALQTGLAAGFANAVSVCGLDPKQIRALEAGSSSCLWTEDPTQGCDGNFQPGVSDHDISLFLTDEMWKAGKSGKLISVCTADELSKVFVDAETGRPIPIQASDESGRFWFRFEDISFFPNRLKEYRAGLFALTRTDPALGGDALNDMALGRQLLLMKYLTESRFVVVPGFPDISSTSDPENPGDANALSQEAILTKVREHTSVPRVEGYEWSNLQEFNFYKVKSLVRITGASDESSSLHGLYVSQLHTAAKSGIRTAFARVLSDGVANPNTREPDGRLTPGRALDFVRSGNPADVSPIDPDKSGDGSRGRLVFEKNACLEIDPTVKPALWLTKPCTSFEEYAASAAAWTMRPWVAPGGTRQPALGVFTLQEIFDVFKFYQVKADRISITDEKEADAFVRTLARFIEKAKVVTKPAYDELVDGPFDPWRGELADNGMTRRRDNMQTKQTAILAKGYPAHVGVVPHVYNRSYRDALDIPVVMTRAQQGASTETKERKVNIEGGDHQYLEWELDAAGKKKQVFQLDVNQLEDRGRTGTVVFTVDLPGRTVTEADRTNNVAGFSYYILDPASDAKPELPRVASPYPESALVPDLECAAQPTLGVSQQLEVFRYTDESPLEMVPVLLESPVMLALRQPATLEITVSNPSAVLVPDVTVCTTLTNRCYGAGAIGAGSSTTVGVAYLPAMPVVMDAIPTVFSPTTSVIVGDAFRIVAGCSHPVISPLVPDPNPSADASRIMLGGTSFRYFRVIDRATGAPLPGVTVKATLSGANSGTFDFVTGLDGVIGTGGTLPGVTIPFRDSMSLGDALVKLEAWGDEAATCGAADPLTYNLHFVEGEFKEGIQAGSEIVAGMAALGGHVTFGIGGGLSMSVESRRRPGADQRNRLWLDFNRKISANGDITYKFNTFAAKVDGIATVSGPAGSATAALGITVGDKFRYSLSGAGDLVTFQEGDGMRLADVLVEPLGKAGFFANGPTAWWKMWWKTFRRTPQPVFGVRKIGDFAKLGGTLKASGTILEGKLGFTEGQYSFGEWEPDYSSTPYVNGEVTGSGKIGVAYEVERRFIPPFEIAPSITIEAEYQLGATLDNAFGKIAKEIETDESETSIEKDLAVKLLKELHKRLSAKFGADGYGGMKLGLAAGRLGEQGSPTDPARWGVRQIDVSFLSKKPFGFTPDGETPRTGGGRYTLTYSVTSEAQIEKVLESVLSFQGLLSAQQRSEYGVGAGSSVVAGGPQSLLEAFMEFVRYTLDTARYTERVDRGKGIANFNFGVEGELFGTGGKFKLNPLKVDSTISYATEKGVLTGGRSYKLEDYQTLSLDPSKWYELLLDVAVKAALHGGESELAPTQRTDAPDGQGGEIRTANGSKIAITNPADYGSAGGLMSTTFEASVGPVQSERYLPTDMTGPAAKPHYGVGGFHEFTPVDLVLASPATLVLAYSDEELVGIDESTLRVYRWNDDRSDWDVVGGVVDGVTNTVTAAIHTLGTYTLAPPMPAGSLEWTASDVTTTGSGTDQKSVARLRSQPLLRNDGQPVVPGTIVHVRLAAAGSAGADGPTPVGRILTPDALPEVDGTQVTVGTDGCVEVRIEVPGSPSSVRVISYSEVGTAGSDVVVVIQS